MTEGDVSAREQETISARRAVGAPRGSLADNVPGQWAIVELFRAQDVAAERSRFARLFGMSPLTTESKPWYDAAVSEIAVGTELGRLSEDWVVLHALPLGTGATIDHLVAGPGGVFIINTRHHPGQTVWASQRAFLVAGIRHPYIRNMEYEMGRSERLLSAAVAKRGHPVPVEVAGILAVVAAKNITVREKHRDVTVLPTTAVVSWLTNRETVLSPADVVEIGRAAQLWSTWNPGGQVGADVTGGIALPQTVAGDREALGERFLALRAEVRSAWRLQVLWATVTTLIGAGGFVLITYSILVNALASLATR
ncbi:hypothetical protein HD599_001087 [Conyzicola lurida]|uniref:NERD domain-containing protein n=1 Tax=Conyzicola lurida TaxID=1172621 RepID=A0A841AK18_9MICO|nr:nuclease-related domain-containing protein [Conyzicola lurida]MBB5842764.1 hypothetical protein [Conyzicola lurida]